MNPGPGSESVESKPLDHQGIPYLLFFFFFLKSHQDSNAKADTPNQLVFPRQAGAEFQPGQSHSSSAHSLPPKFCCQIRRLHTGSISPKGLSRGRSWLPQAETRSSGVDHPLCPELVQGRAVSHDLGEAPEFQNLQRKRGFAYLLHVWDSRSIGTKHGFWQPRLDLEHLGNFHLQGDTFLF